MVLMLGPNSVGVRLVRGIVAGLTIRGGCAGSQGWHSSEGGGEMSACASVVGIGACCSGTRTSGLLLLAVAPIVAMPEHTAQLPTKVGAHAIEMGSKVGLLNGGGDDDGARLAHRRRWVAICATGGGDGLTVARTRRGDVGWVSCKVGPGVDLSLVVDIDVGLLTLLVRFPSILCSNIRAAARHCGS